MVATEAEVLEKELRRCLRRMPPEAKLTGDLLNGDSSLMEVEGSEEEEEGSEEEEEVEEKVETEVGALAPSHLGKEGTEGGEAKQAEQGGKQTMRGDGSAIDAADQGTSPALNKESDGPHPPPLSTQCKVEKLLAVRRHHSLIQYLVQFVGFPLSNDDWLSPDDIATDLVETFHAEHNLLDEDGSFSTPDEVSRCPQSTAMVQPWVY